MSFNTEDDNNSLEQTQNYLKSRSAPTTPRNGVDPNISASPLSSPREDYPPEVQMLLLKEKLGLAEKQLIEKDKQIDHYKQLVKTLKDVLAEVSGKRVPRETAVAIRPPPGFEPGSSKPKYPIKGRKVKSFNHEYYQPELDDDEDEDPFNRQLPNNNNNNPNNKSPPKLEKKDNPVAWRKHSSDDAEGSGNGNKKEKKEEKETKEGKSNNGFKISKSISHTALASLATEPPSKEELRALNTTNTNLPQRQNIQSIEQVVGTQSPTTGKKMGSLKKSQSMTSVYSVMEENRLDSKFPDFDQMVGQIYALSKYQQGCRFLQKKLDEKNPSHSNIILNELYDHLTELMTDPFGNYLFSKLMEHCPSEQRERVITKILPEILNIAFDMYGTQSLQKMMPFLTEDQINLVISKLKDNAIPLIKHNKANYLIQYCLDNLDIKYNQWIYDAVTDSMEDLSRDRVGCVIVKKCFDHSTEELKSRMVIEVMKKAVVLVQDPFGNYVVQYILEKYPSEDNSQRMIERLLGSITDLCTQKFSSNVIERCLKVSRADIRARMLTEITESELLPQLLNDRFANFVIQTALDVAEPEQRQQLVKNILPHLGRHYSQYTKRLQKKILQV